MKLEKILKLIKTEIEVSENLSNELEIVDIEIDSRLAKSGSAFFAMPGKSQNGSKFIQDAIKNGAKLVVARNFDGLEINEDIVTIKCDDLFALLVEFLKVFYSPLPSNIYAITGTNGKTSISEYARQILQLFGKKSASIGTLGVICDDVSSEILQKSSLTTPDIVSFYKNLAILKENLVDDVFIETSSIGLEQKRIAGLDIGVGGFSNFTQDHLDYHGSMEEYFRCKMLLFKEVLQDGSVAVLNSDIPDFENILEICQNKNQEIVTYGFRSSVLDGESNKNIKFTEIKAQDSGQKVTFQIGEKSYEINLNIAGEFQVFNILCALAMVLSKHEMSDENLRKVLKDFDKIIPASGRMQKVATLANKAQVFIDFAHSPDALENVLKMARNVAKSRLVVLIGCGGDRDPKKRPIMGKIACDLADLVIVTDDNPRTENAADIRSEILDNCDSVKTIEIANRKDAIEASINMLQENDILVLAGKGHEKYQIIGDEKFEFDEEKIVKDAI